MKTVLNRFVLCFAILLGGALALSAQDVPCEFVDPNIYVTNHTDGNYIFEWKLTADENGMKRVFDNGHSQIKPNIKEKLVGSFSWDASNSAVFKGEDINDLEIVLYGPLQQKMFTHAIHREDVFYGDKAFEDKKLNLYVVIHSAENIQVIVGPDVDHPFKGTSGH